MIICRANTCPYNKEKYCAKPMIILNRLGLCDFIWNENGDQRPQRITDSFNNTAERFHNDCIEIMINEGVINHDDEGTNLGSSEQGE